jgi:hypothetical protein
MTSVPHRVTGTTRSQFVLVTARPVPSASIISHYPLMNQLLDVIQSDLPTASLNSQTQIQAFLLQTSSQVYSQVALCPAESLSLRLEIFKERT